MNDSVSIFFKLSLLKFESEVIAKKVPRKKNKLAPIFRLEICKHCKVIIKENTKNSSVRKREIEDGSCKN